MVENNTTQKTPEISREFFGYSVVFTDLEFNTPQTKIISMQGESFFETRKLNAIYVLQSDTPVANNLVNIARINITIVELGTDRGFFFNNQTNLAALQSNARVSIDLPKPVLFPAKTRLKFTVTNPYATTIAKFQMAFWGNKAFVGLPPQYQGVVQ